RGRLWVTAPVWVDRAALYVLGTYSVYFLSTSGHGGASQVAETAGFLLLGVWLVGGLLDSQRGAFKLTALDVLIVAATIWMSTLGPWNVNDYAVEVTKVLAWFYAVELLLARFRHARPVQALSVFGCCTIVARWAPA